jgi:hypothetical protein
MNNGSLSLHRINAQNEKFPISFFYNGMSIIQCTDKKID